MTANPTNLVELPHCVSCVNDDHSDYNNYIDEPCCVHETIEICLKHGELQTGTQS